MPTFGGQRGGFLPLLPLAAGAIGLLGKQIGLGKGGRLRGAAAASKEQKLYWLAKARAAKQRKNQRGGAIPFAAAIPLLATLGKTVGLGALAGSAGLGAKELIKAIA